MINTAWVKILTVPLPRFKSNIREHSNLLSYHALAGIFGVNPGVETQSDISARASQLLLNKCQSAFPIAPFSNPQCSFMEPVIIGHAIAELLFDTVLRNLVAGEHLSKKSLPNRTSRFRIVLKVQCVMRPKLGRQRQQLPCLDINQAILEDQNIISGPSTQ